MSNSLGRFVFGAMVGGAIGAVMGMLLAPRSGAETREMIREELSTRYTESVDRLNEGTETVREKVRTITDDLERTGRETLDKALERK